MHTPAAAIPTRPFKQQPTERVAKDTIVVDNQLPDCDDGPILQRISIMKDGTPIQTVTSCYAFPGVSVLFSLKPILHFGLAYDIIEGETYIRKMNVMARYTAALEDFPYGLRIEASRGSSAGSFFFTGHSKPSLSSMEEDFPSDLTNGGEVEYSGKSNGKAMVQMGSRAEEIIKLPNYTP